MFSTMPRIGTSVFSNIFKPRTTSINAMSCGVETIRLPEIFSFFTRLKCISPVPGGISITIISALPQFTLSTISFIAFITIGPLQTNGLSLSTI